MKILLINPPYSRLRMTKECTEMVAPLGLLYLAATAERGGFSVSVYDANFSGADKLKRLNAVGDLLLDYHKYGEGLDDGGHPLWRECAARVAAEKPDVIGITALTPVLGSAMKVAAVCRESAPGAKIVFGGFHPTCRPGDVLRGGAADVVVRGEGEETFLELLESLREDLPISNIAGISFAENGEVRSNPDRPLIADLAWLPSVAEFSRCAASGKMPIQYGRGCTSLCKFCSDEAVWRRTSRHIPAEKLADDIAAIVKNSGVREFTFVDGTFNIKKDLVIELCEAIISKKTGILWDALVRADRLDDEMLSMCRRAGCAQLNVGVESGSAAVIKDLKKGINLDTVRGGIERIRRHGIVAVSFFCTGTPSENEDDMRATRDLILSLPHNYVILHMFTPMPGSEYFDELVAEGLIPEDHDFNSFGYKSPENYFVKNMERADFERWRGEVTRAVDAVNRRGGIIFKMLFNNFRFYLKHPALLLRKALAFMK